MNKLTIYTTGEVSKIYPRGPSAYIYKVYGYTTNKNTVEVIFSDMILSGPIYISKKYKKIEVISDSIVDYILTSVRSVQFYSAQFIAKDITGQREIIPIVKDIGDYKVSVTMILSSQDKSLSASFSLNGGICASEIVGNNAVNSLGASKFKSYNGSLFYTYEQESSYENELFRVVANSIFPKVEKYECLVSVYLFSTEEIQLGESNPIIEGVVIR